MEMGDSFDSLREFPMCTEKQTYQDIQAVYEYSTSDAFNVVCSQVLEFYDKKKGGEYKELSNPKVILYGQSIGSGPR